MLDSPDRVAELFIDKTVFISGGSGFLGKVLIEKLLRCCPEIKKIYILIRRKKGMSSNERLTDIFKNPLFDVLRKQQPSAQKKCVAITGDVTESNLGISEYFKNILIDETDFIIHSAATTRFDDSMKYAVTMNTRGTQYMLDLAHQCKQLKLFVHVSTAYAYPDEKILREQAYEPPADPKDVLESINWIKEDSMGKFTKELLGTSPNTYTFTKALAEKLVINQVGKLPVIIIRPSVVVPIYDSPLPGWCNNLQGPMGLFVGAGKGVIRSMYMDPKAHANLIPADSTINIILLAALEYLTHNQNNYIYNAIVPKEDFCKSWEEIIETGKKIIYDKIPFNMILWYPGGGITTNKFLHNVYFYLFQLIPAIFVDILLFVLGYKPILYKIQRRIQMASDMFVFYTTRVWDFESQSIWRFRKWMNETEKKNYKVDPEGLDIEKYLLNCMLSVRRINLKESDDMLPRARLVMNIMFVVDRLCKILFFVGIFYYMYKLLLNL